MLPENKILHQKYLKTNAVTKIELVLKCDEFNQ